MTSARQGLANRANARASTGPNTAKGKACSAKNALRHGLSLSALTDPIVAQEVEVLARRIAGRATDAETLAGARRIAEPQIDVQRVRTHRLRRIDHALADPHYAGKTAERTLALSIDELRLLGGAPKLTTILADLAREIAALDRYERRALSRRKFAIRDFDEAQCRRGMSAGSSGRPRVPSAEMQ